MEQYNIPLCTRLSQMTGLAAICSVGCYLLLALPSNKPESYLLNLQAEFHATSVYSRFSVYSKRCFSR